MAVNQTQPVPPREPRTEWCALPLRWFGVGFAIVHFLVTGYFALDLWTHDSSAGPFWVLSFPGRLAAAWVPGDWKFRLGLVLCVNSVLWAFCVVGLIALTRSYLRRRFPGPRCPQPCPSCRYEQHGNAARCPACGRDSGRMPN